MKTAHIPCCIPGLFILCLCGALICSSAIADVYWKLGVGVGNLTTNDYPGTDKTQSNTLPIPYLEIKTDWFNVDRDGLHTEFFKQTNFRFDLNFDINTPVDSESNELRQGMPNLDPVVQAGPNLIYILTNDSDNSLQLQLPVHMAWSVDDTELSSIGWISHPRIYYKGLFGLGVRKWHISSSFGPVYANGNYNQFYYTVGSDYASVTRNEYQASGGFSGYRLNMGMTKRFNGYWLGMYIRYQNITGAVFEDSPLVNARDYWLIAFGASWLFAGNL